MADTRVINMVSRASNTKYFLGMQGMKYWGDSLVGISYAENDTALIVELLGIQFFAPGFSISAGYSISYKKLIKKYLSVPMDLWRETALGPGWAWMITTMNILSNEAPAHLSEICSLEPA